MMVFEEKGSKVVVVAVRRRPYSTPVLKSVGAVFIAL